MNAVIIQLNNNIAKESELRKKKLLERESLNFGHVGKKTSTNVYVYVSDDFILRSGRIESGDFERLSIAA